MALLISDNFNLALRACFRASLSRSITFYARPLIRLRMDTNVRRNPPEVTLGKCLQKLLCRIFMCYLTGYLY